MFFFYYIRHTHFLFLADFWTCALLQSVIYFPPTKSYRLSVVYGQTDTLIELAVIRLVKVPIRHDGRML